MMGVILSLSFFVMALVSSNTPSATGAPSVVLTVNSVQTRRLGPSHHAAWEYVLNALRLEVSCQKEDVAVAFQPGAPSLLIVHPVEGE